jgi:hypothetical protein
MRSFILFLLLLLSSDVVLAQEADWRTFAPDECDFSIEMPADPEMWSERAELHGHTLRTFTYDAQDGMIIFSVNCSDVPFAEMLGTKEYTWMILKEVAKARVGGEPADLEEIEINGYAGVAYVEKISYITTYHQAFIVKDKMYQLYVSDLRGSGQASAEKYFQSFSVE